VRFIYFYSVLFFDESKAFLSYFEAFFIHFIVSQHFLKLKFLRWNKFQGVRKIMEENISEKSGFVRLALGTGLTACGIAHLSKESGGSRTLGSLFLIAGALKVAEGIFLYCPTKALISSNVKEAVATTFDEYLDGDSLMNAYNKAFENKWNENGNSNTQSSGQSSNSSSSQGQSHSSSSNSSQHAASSSSSQGQSNSTVKDVAKAASQVAQAVSDVAPSGTMVKTASQTVKTVADSVSGSSGSQNSSQNSSQNK
jgi:hypothetical protein